MNATGFDPVIGGSATLLLCQLYLMEETTMIQIRPGIFETNSSSVHAIAVSKKEPASIPDHVWFHLGKFGWAFDYVDPQDYLYTGIVECGLDDCLRVLKETLDDLGVEYEFEDPDNREWFYIDHSENVASIIYEIVRDRDMLIRFLFSNASFVHTGNDNSDDCEELECNSTIWEYNHFNNTSFERPNPNHDPENFDYFRKGN